MDAAELVRSCRVRAGLTQEQLAVRAGTTKTAISRLERGHVSPSIETLDRLFLCLGLRLEVAAIPLEPRTDPTQLATMDRLSPTERLEHGLASSAALHGLVGSARRG